MATLKAEHEIRRTGRNLKPIFTLQKSLKALDGTVTPPAAGGDGTVQDGVAINDYGRGQVSGVMYTVPAHGSISVDTQIKMQCVSQDDVVNLNNFIRGLLDVSQYQHYDDLAKTDISGGASFFGMFGWGGASASYSDTKHTMSGFGLSEANQVTIINAMAALVQNFNVIHTFGTVNNTPYDYSVTGNVWCIVMDATIQQSDGSVQNRRLVAPNGLVVDPTSGASLPVIPPAK